MDVVGWMLLMLVGITGAALGSKRAVGSALEVSSALGVSASIVGVTVLAVGTDLPEIANSITASLSGHGDLNVGDSTGSALTQITLVLALLILGARLNPSGKSVEASIAVSAGLMTVGALVLLALLLSDGELSRVDGLVMVTGWVVTLVALQRRDRATSKRPASPDLTDSADSAASGNSADSADSAGSPASAAILRLLGWLVLVGIASTVVIRSFTELTAAFGVPEYIASSIVLALGTSLPELVVDWTAIRRGVPALALADLFGSSLVDATLSVGIGPALSPTSVSPETVAGTLVIAVGVATATILISTSRRRSSTAAGLLLVYGLATLALLSIAA